MSSKKFIIGIDECGMGCLAGGVYVCAFRAPKDWKIDGARDSKKLTAKKREIINKQLLSLKNDGHINFSIESLDVEEIDRLNIYHAAHEAYYNAIVNLLKETNSSFDENQIITDGLKFKETRYEFTSIVKGDDLVQHISAASIIAKVARDAYMDNLHKHYPAYNWTKNKGYATAEHLKAIKDCGVSKFHRKSFEPIKSIVSSSNNLI